MDNSLMMSLHNSVELEVVEVSNEIIVNNMSAISFSKLSGTSASLLPMVQSLSQVQGGGKVYKAVIPKTASLTPSSTGVGMRGFYTNGSKFAGHAELVPIPVDPMMLAVNIALHQITQSLENIK